MRKSALPVGKIPVDLLRTLLARFTKIRDRRVMVGPRIGLDAAVIRIGGRVLIVKTDPITFVADEIGTYALLVFPRFAVDELARLCERSYEY